MARVLIEIVGKDLAGAAFRSVKNGARDMAGEVRNALGTVGRFISSPLGMLGLTVSAGAVAKGIFDANVQFQRFQAQLRTFEGNRAPDVFERLQKFAITSPFELAEITEAFITLRAAGIRPTDEMMTDFGNHASAMGQRIQDLAAAVRSATTGEMERMKMMGVVMRLEGDQIVASYNGVTTTIRRDTKSIVGYLQSLSKTNFGGAMEREVKTLGGALSNLQDALFSAAVAMGEGGLSGEASTAISKLTELANKVRDVTEAMNEGRGAPAEWKARVKDAFEFTGAHLNAFGHLLMVMASPTPDNVKAAVAAYKEAGRFTIDSPHLDRARARQTGMDRESIGVNIAETWQAPPVKDDTPATTPGIGKGDPRADQLAIISALASRSETVHEAAEKARLMRDEVRAALGKKGVTDEERANLIGHLNDLEKLIVDFLVGKASGSRNTALEGFVDDALKGGIGQLKAPGVNRSTGTAVGQVPLTVMGGNVFGGDILTDQEILATLPKESPIAKMARDFADARKGALELDNVVGGILIDGFEQFGGAVQGAFEAVVSGSASAAEVTEQLMGSMLAGVASGFARMFEANAVASFASVFGPIPNPGGIQAGIGWMAAAAGMHAIAGSARGAFNVGGRSGHGSGFGRGGFAPFGDADARGTATLIVKGGGVWDMNNPENLLGLAKALSDLSGMRIEIERRSS